MKFKIKNAKVLQHSGDVVTFEVTSMVWDGAQQLITLGVHIKFPNGVELDRTEVFSSPTFSQPTIGNLIRKRYASKK